MRVLLDTHSLLWLVTDDPRLSANARKTFLDIDNELLFSAVVGFEIAVKHSLGKLELAEPPRTFIDNRIRNNALTPFPITLAHAVRVAELPFHHRDPFDRLLVAQALEEDLPLLSADNALSAYGIRQLW
ncbi:type II toxin-antitoxin system VapC family toxin [Candidatus Thiosymbion oneisti]|uniref:type II toxin-antitoxin system VapC family toxin n=1 Tax=Candidatus Thiosymbion oneisti TaxID=589554 RepID=UPI00105F7D18|nr:type II toxin-antitoxin system VapC family toxin [Candidatus Thiosymbion oneisti]